VSVVAYFYLFRHSPAMFRTGVFVMGLLFLTSTAGCDGAMRPEVCQEDWRSKIGFSLSPIRPDGLTGSADGLVSVAYEFCIPGNGKALATVQSIDPSIACHGWVLTGGHPLQKGPIPLSRRHPLAALVRGSASNRVARLRGPHRPGLVRVNALIA